MAGYNTEEGVDESSHVKWLDTIRRRVWMRADTINTVVTPIRLHLKGYFTHILQKNKEGRKRAVNKQKHKPQFYGEALTMDEFYEKVVEAEQKKQEEEKKKEEKKKEKKKGQSKTRVQRAHGKKVAAKKSTPLTARRGTGRVKSKLPAGVPSPSPEPISDSNTESDESTDDTGMCEECGGVYKDDDHDVRKSWMGCDTCDRWFHCRCVGLTRIPKGFWSCKYCMN